MKFWWIPYWGWLAFFPLLSFGQTLVYDQAGNPVCARDYVLIRFNSAIVNTNFTDDSTKNTTVLAAFLTQASALNEINTILNGASSWPVNKLFTDCHSRLDSSISRTGRKVADLRFWAVVKLGIPHDLHPFEVADVMRGFEGLVVYCHPDWVIPYDYVPNDPDLPRQRYITDPGNGVLLNHLHVDDAWNFERFGKPFVRLGIMDSGIDQVHPDIFVTAGAQIDENNSISALTPPYFSTPHGTRVAGIASAIADNAEGIAGIAAGASLVDMAFRSTFSHWSVTGHDKSRWR